MHNNFDFIRLMAAFLVVFRHAYGLNAEASTPLMNLTNNQINEGGLGVYIFFIISGYLICSSFMRKKSILYFIKARFLRIVPGVTVVTLLIVFILGPLVTSLKVSEYFNDVQTWYFLRNCVPLEFFHALPGVFTFNPYGPNGSLWTIPYEIRCYSILFFCGIIGLLNKRTIVLLFFIIIYMCFLKSFNGNAFLYIMFYSGMLFYLWRDKLIFSWIGVFIAILGLYFASQLGNIIEVFPIFGSYIIFYIAFATWIPLQNISKYGDFSYGIYIYSFPIQQLIIYIHGGKMSVDLNLFYSIPLILIFAFLSWHLVEKKALKLKY